MIKIDVEGNNSVQQAWETLNCKIASNHSFNVDERTMSSRDLVRELSQINLDAQNSLKITYGTRLHDQKMSNLCVYFAVLSALRHEIKNFFKDLGSSNVDYRSFFDAFKVLLPTGKSIDRLLIEKEFFNPWSIGEKIPNALSFERMLSMLIGCISPRALSGNGSNMIDQMMIFLFRKYFGIHLV